MAEIGEVWALLRAAVSERTPFTAMQLATADAGGAPAVRMVILRRFDEAGPALAFVTHAAAPKALHLAAMPRVALGGYDPGRDVQLRLGGTALVVGDGAEREAVFATLPPATRAMFAGPTPPGTPLPPGAGGGEPVDVPERPTPYFALVRVELDEADLLELAPPPHRRTRFRRADGWSGLPVLP